MNSDSRRRSTGLIFFAVMLALAGLRIASSFIFTTSSDNDIDMIYTSISQLFCMGALPIILYYFLILKNEGRPFKDIFVDLGYKRKAKLSPKVIIVSVLCIIPMFFLTIGISGIWQGILSIFGFTNISSVGTIFNGYTDLFKWLFFIAILPACFEELTFRGVMLNGYENESPRTIIFISALTFALMHENIQQFGYAFVGGIIMASFSYRSRSIFPAMILHFGNNALSQIISYSSQMQGPISNMIDKFFDFYNSFAIAILLMIVWFGIFAGFIKISKYFDKWTATANGYVPEISQPLRIKFNRNDIFLYSGIILSGISTIFTLIWGLSR